MESKWLVDLSGGQTDDPPYKTVGPTEPDQWRGCGGLKERNQGFISLGDWCIMTAGDPGKALGRVARGIQASAET